MSQANITTTRSSQKNLIKPEEKFYKKDTKQLHGIKIQFLEKP